MYKKYPKGLTLTKDKQQLVLDNLGIAHKLAHQWFNGVVEFEDLKQQAYLILVDCAAKFDPDKGNKFSTYAYNCINIVLNNYVQNYNKIVAIPLNKIYKIHKYLKLPDEEKEAYRLASKISMEDIKFYSTYEIVSIDAQVNDDYDDVVNFYPYEEVEYDNIENRSVIECVLNNLNDLILNELDRNIFREVILCNFDTQKYKEISKSYNVKLKEIYNAIERCQELMQAHKNEFF